MKDYRNPEPEQIAEWIENDKAFRVAYFEHNFEEFFIYHWGWIFKDFHHKWATDMENGESMEIIGFRSSRKTTLARGFAVWAILYQKHDYIVVQSFEDVLSGAWVHQVAKMLLEDSIVEDYGTLFPLETKKDELAKKSVSNFDATNGVRIESKSLGQTLRGANVYKKRKGQRRPTLLFLDDIDVEKSVANVEIIDKNVKKIQGETIGSLDPKRRQIIFLGNVINEDGVVPRFEKEYAGKWKIYRQPLFNERGENVWPEEFTDEVIANIRKDEGEIAFGQNYHLIPYVDGQTIIPRSLIKTIERYPKEVRVIIGIDPAFSLKTTSDPIAITVTGHHNGNKYVLACYELIGTQKQEKIYRPFIKQLYTTFKVSNVNIESNNGGEIIARQLQEDGMSITLMKAEKDKVTRLKEKESYFTKGEVYFLPGTEELQNRLVRFPNVKHDDIVDALVYSLDSGDEIFVGGF